MRKTLRQIYINTWNNTLEETGSITLSHKRGLKAVSEAVRKRVKRQIAAENLRNEMAESKWVLR